jgi:hypothetical protein
MIRVPVTSGSDVRFVFTFTDVNDSPVPVSAPEVILASAELTRRITATLTNGAGGVVSLFIDGTRPIPVGNHTFRLRVLTAGGDHIASRGILLDVS